jgi:hypothetical protein
VIPTVFLPIGVREKMDASCGMVWDMPFFKSRF